MGFLIIYQLTLSQACNLYWLMAQAGQLDGSAVGMHFSSAFHLQTRTISIDGDDCDDKVNQNSDTQSNVIITNI